MQAFFLNDNGHIRKSCLFLQDNVSSTVLIYLLLIYWINLKLYQDKKFMDLYYMYVFICGV